jgi:hypothetical protein
VTAKACALAAVQAVIGCARVALLPGWVVALPVLMLAARSTGRNPRRPRYAWVADVWPGRNAAPAAVVPGCSHRSAVCSGHLEGHLGSRS